MRTINANKNHILAVFFGIISGIKEHSFWWGVLIAVVGYAAFCGLDRLSTLV